MKHGTVLVIGTDSDTEDKIVTTLENHGNLVFTAMDGEWGVDMAEKVSPSLIFVDTTTEDEHTLQMCAQIHSSETLKDVPIIALDTRERSIDVHLTSGYGIVDFLKKPFSKEELFSKTENACRAQSRSQSPQGDVSEMYDRVAVETAETAATDSHPDLNADIDFLEEREPGKKGEPFVSPVRFDESAQATSGPDVSLASISETPVSHGSEEKQPVPGKERQRVGEEKTKTEDAHVSEGVPHERKRSLYLIIPAICLFFPVLGIAGFFLYQYISSGQVVQTPMIIKPSVPIYSSSTQESPINVLRDDGKDISVLAPAQQPRKEGEPAAMSKPVTAAESAVKKEPLPETFYSVQIGAFLNKSNADSLVNTYREKGYEVFLHTTEIKGNRILYRVLIGTYQDSTGSVRMARNIEASEKISTAIYKRR